MEQAEPEAFFYLALQRMDLRRTTGFPARAERPWPGSMQAIYNPITPLQSRTDVAKNSRLRTYKASGSPGTWMMHAPQLWRGMMTGQFWLTH